MLWWKGAGVELVLVERVELGLVERRVKAKADRTQRVMALID